MADDLDTYDPVRGPARERMDADELVDDAVRAAVVLDRRRRKARFFADRFLAARDLTRGQIYTLLREADLAQLSGAGVVFGLDVTTDATGLRLTIAPGLGVARSGESIALRDAVSITVAKLRVLAGRTVATQLVAENAATRPTTGLFMLVARPVEHARNAIATFPSGAVSKIEIAPSELVEGTWFTLTPLPSSGQKDAVARGRARLAREVFVGGFDPTVLTDGLAVAVIGVVNGRVQWVDPHLPAREVGGDGVVGFGVQTRKTRLAYQHQFSRQLDEELARRRNAGLPDGLPATEAFAALPPVGPLPRGAVVVTPTDVLQSFFPREIYVEMAIMPADEIPALLGEGLVRAPIDLESGSAALEGVPVLIVVPVARAGFDERTPRMKGVYRGPGISATGRQIVDARPIDALTVLRLKNEPSSSSDPLPLDLEAWRKAVEGAEQLWYVRRPQYVTTSVVVPRDPETDLEMPPLELMSDVARERVEDAIEDDRFNMLFGSVSTEARNLIDELLRTEVFDGGGSLPSDDGTPATEASVYVSGLLGELAYLARRPRPIDPGDPAPQLRSPAFDTYPPTTRLRVRPVDVIDVKRLVARYSLPIQKPLRVAALRNQMVRSVLATAAVVPELALWCQTPEAVEAGGADHIAELASRTDIAGLRELAASVATQQPS